MHTDQLVTRPPVHKDPAGLRARMRGSRALIPPRVRLGVLHDRKRVETRPGSQGSLPLVCTAIDLCRSRMAMAVIRIMVMVVIVLILSITCPALDKFVGKRRLLASISSEAHCNPANASHTARNLLPESLFHGVQVTHSPLAGSAHFDIDKEVLAALDALDAPDFSLAAALRQKSCLCGLLHVVLHLFVHSDVRQLQQGRLRISPARLHDHATDGKSTHRIQPRRVRQEMACRDGQQSDKSRQAIHAVMVGVASQYRAPLLVCNLHRRPVQPLLDYDATAGQPGGVDVGAEVLGAVAVRVAVAEDLEVGENVCDFGEELLRQGHDGLQADHDAAGEEQTGDGEGAERFDLAVAGWETGGCGFEGVGDRCEGHDVGDEIGKGMEGVCCQSVCLCQQLLHRFNKNASSSGSLTLAS